MEQQENHTRLLTCLPDVEWPQEIDINQNVARQSIRCITRDHLPIVGRWSVIYQILINLCCNMHS
ncbi:MAG: hypothetical protein AB8W37_01895 [Arsenophonus endosymbiont of Dermacentor nuttalli]